MKDKKKYATRLDQGEIPGLFFIAKCSYKFLYEYNKNMNNID